LFLNHRQEKS